ncbi:MAG: amidohydrolase family protein [Bacteroidota bacterium]
MTGKENSKIDALLNKLSEQHQPGSYVFRNVKTLTMLDSQMIEQDVWIEDGVIKEIRPNILTQKAIEIDGSNRYLMPGLTDMHIHLFNGHQMKNTWMLLLLINGITSVRDMAGEPGKLALIDQINKNEVLAPNIYQAGPIIKGLGRSPVFVVASTPDEGRKQVRDQKQLGYDFIKVYDDLSRETYFAIVDEAQKQGIPVVGHVPFAIRMEESLNKQSSIEHLTGYIGWRKRVETYIKADQGYAFRSANSDTWNCPTFYNLMLNWDKKFIEDVLGNPEISGLLPDKLVKRWKGLLSKNTDEKEKLLAAYGKSNQELFTQTVLELYQSNNKLLAGTDAGNLPLLVPGFSLHQELNLLNSIGITAYDVLKMTTVNAAIAMNKEREFGTIEVGKRADLLLLDKNPLEKIDHLRSQAGVMVRGIWLSDHELEFISQEIRTIFGKE